MKNDKNSAPDTVQDLLDLQVETGGVEETVDPCDFIEAMNEVIETIEPSPNQVLLAARMLVHRLEAYHCSMVNNTEEMSEFSAFQRTIWKDDYKNLRKAIKHLRLVHED
jgi:hypothetical protein